MNSEYIHLFLPRVIALSAALFASVSGAATFVTTADTYSKNNQASTNFGAQDVLRVQTELAKLQDDENRLRWRRVSAVASLNRLMSRPPSRPLPLTGPAQIRPAAAELDELLALATAQNPELATLTHQMERDQHQIELADLAYWPDVTVGFEWTHGEPRSGMPSSSTSTFSVPAAMPRSETVSHSCS